MRTYISLQLLLFVQSILLGLSAGALYDLLRPFRLRLPRLGGLLDGIYCLTVGAVFFQFLLRRGDGELRGFMVLGVVGGATLFFCAFSQWLRTVWDFWADTLSYLAHLLALPLFWLKNFCKKVARHGKILFYFGRKCYTIKNRSCRKNRKS